MNEPLKPCPFCGSFIVGHIEVPWVETTVRRIICGVCRAEGGTESTEPEAIEAWNRRATTWRNFATERPEDNQMVLINIGGNWEPAYYWDTKPQSDTQGVTPEPYFVTWRCGRVYPNKSRCCLWQPLPAPPTPEEIERAKEVER